MKKLITLLTTLQLLLFGVVVLAQTNQIVDLGKPLIQANISELNGYIVPSSKNPTDYTAIIIDKGPLNPNNNALALFPFKVIFVDLFSKQYEVVTLKNLQGAEVTETVGDVFTTQFGADGNIYVGTQGGGHLIRIDYKSRTVTDLGNPNPTYFNSIPNITTLGFGTDFSLYGIINKINQPGTGAYSFKYDYFGRFTDVDSLPIDANRHRVKMIGSDDTYTYVRAEDADYKLYAINKLTKTKSEIVLQYNGAPLNPSTAFEIETYVGDYVYARISLTNTAYYWKLHNGQVLDNQAPNVYLRKRADLVWKKLIYNYGQISTMWNATDFKLYYQKDSIIDFVDLNNAVQKVTRPTGAITPYFNLGKKTNELFVHGSKYSTAASIAYENNNTITKLGANPTLSIYAATTNFDNTKVLIGGYANGTIQEFNSGNDWNIFTSPTAPVFTTSAANPAIKYQVQKPENSTNNVPGILSIASIKKLNTAQLIVAGGNRGRNNPPYYNDEITVSIINSANNTFKNVYYEAEFKDYMFSSLSIDQVNQKIILIGVKREMPNQGSSKLFILDVNGNLVGTPQNLLFNGFMLNYVRDIEVVNNTLYFRSDNFIYRINNYNNPTNIEKMLTLQGMYFKAMGLVSSNNNKYIVAAYELPGLAGYKLIYMPLTTTNNVLPSNDNDVTKVEGVINENNGTFPYEFTAADNKVFLSGFTSIYSFDLAVNKSDKVLTAVYNTNNFGCTVGPNPANNTINVMYKSNEIENIQVQIFNMNSVLMYNKAHATIAGGNTIPIAISSYPNGNYVVKVITKTTTYTSKFIKQ